MKSGKSQRIQVGGKTGNMSQKRKDSSVEKIITDNVNLQTEPITSHPKKSKQDNEERIGSSKTEDKKKKKIKEVKTLKESDKGKEKTETTEKVPKKKIGKNFSVPAKWFINHTARERWLDGYALQPISFCNMVCPDLIEDMYLGVMKKMKKSSIWKVINPGVIGYPRLTKLFYLNLQVVEGDRLVISSRVAGKDITLDHSVFAKVLGCAESYNVDNHPGRKEGVKMARDEFFYTPHHNPSPMPKQLTRPVLDLEAMILFTILEKCVIPTSEEFLSDKMLYLMYLIMHEYEVDVPTIVMEHMLNTSAQYRNDTLPYANLLPKFFKHFGIPLKNEEKKISEMKMITEMYLEDALFEDEGVEEIFDEENENEETDLMYVIAGGVAGDEMDLGAVETEAEDTGDEKKEEKKDEDENDDTEDTDEEIEEEEKEASDAMVDKTIQGEESEEKEGPEDEKNDDEAKTPLKTLNPNPSLLNSQSLKNFLLSSKVSLLKNLP